MHKAIPRYSSSAPITCRGDKPVPLNDPYDKGVIFRLLFAYRIY
jgi:hypothetical protein